MGSLDKLLPLATPSGYAPVDLELSKFTIVGSQAYVNTLANVQVGTVVASTEYGQGTAAPGTVFGGIQIYL